MTLFVFVTIGLAVLAVDAKASCFGYLVCLSLMVESTSISFVECLDLSVSISTHGCAL